MTHGPECLLSRHESLPEKRGIRTCECVLCHCGPDHLPGGELGTCRRCLRKRREDLLLSAPERRLAA